MATELIVGEPARAELDAPQHAPTAWGATEYVAVIERAAPRYVGPYEVTPSAETQTLDTGGLVMTGSVVVNPIPNNWGLISWNGAVLTVS